MSLSKKGNFEYIDGKFEKAIKCSSPSEVITDNYIEMPNVISDNDLSTISFWINVTNIDAVHTRLIYTNYGTDSGIEFSILLSKDTTVKVGFNNFNNIQRNAAEYLESSVLATNNWYNVIVKVNKILNYIELYIDATLIGIIRNENINGLLVDSPRLFSGYKAGNETSSSSYENPSNDVNIDGLLAHFPLNSTYTNNDVTGNYSATNYGVTFTDSYANFSSRSDTRFITNIQDVFDGRKTYAISFWFKIPRNVGSWMDYIFGTSTRSSIYGSGLVLGYGSAPSTLRLYRANYSNYDAVSSEGTYIDDNWHHVVITYDGTNLSLVVDVTDKKTVSSTISASNAPLLLGTYSTNADTNEYMEGNLKDLRIYNRTLSSEEIVSIYNIGKPNLLNEMTAAYYPLDHAANDIIANHDGVDNGNVSYDGVSANFDGVDAWIKLKDHDASVEFMRHEHTVSFWFKGNSNGSLLSVGAGQGSNSFPNKKGTERFEIIDSALYFKYQRKPNDLTYSKLLISDLKENEWHYISVSQSSNLISLYVDGILKTTDVGSLEVGDDDSFTTSLGCYTYSDGGGANGTPLGFWKGNISKVRFYASVLTDADIEIIYNDEKSVILTSDIENCKCLNFDGYIDQVRLFDRLLIDQEIMILSKELNYFQKDKSQLKFDSDNLPTNFFWFNDVLYSNFNSTVLSNDSFLENPNTKIIIDDSTTIDILSHMTDISNIKSTFVKTQDGIGFGSKDIEYKKHFGFIVPSFFAYNVNTVNVTFKPSFLSASGFGTFELVPNIWYSPLLSSTAFNINDIYYSGNQRQDTFVDASTRSYVMNVSAAYTFNSLNTLYVDQSSTNTADFIMHYISSLSFDYDATTVYNYNFVTSGKLIKYTNNILEATVDDELDTITTTNNNNYGEFYRVSTNYIVYSTFDKNMHVFDNNDNQVVIEEKNSTNISKFKNKFEATEIIISENENIILITNKKSIYLAPVEDFLSPVNIIDLYSKGRRGWVIKSLTFDYTGSTSKFETYEYYLALQMNVFERLNKSHYRETVMSGDGTVIVTGAPFFVHEKNNTGRVYIFKNDSGWHQTTIDLKDISDDNEIGFGAHVAISNDAKRLYVSSYISEKNSMFVYLFELNKNSQIYNDYVYKYKIDTTFEEITAMRLSKENETLVVSSSNEIRIFR